MVRIVGAATSGAKQTRQGPTSMVRVCYWKFLHKYQTHRQGIELLRKCLDGKIQNQNEYYQWYDLAATSQNRLCWE